MYRTITRLISATPRRDLPNEVIKPKFIKKNIYEDLPIKVEADANFEDVDAPARFIPERRYWISAFESAVQFSQNYVSGELV